MIKINATFIDNEDTTSRKIMETKDLVINSKYKILKDRYGLLNFYIYKYDLLEKIDTIKNEDFMIKKSDKLFRRYSIIKNGIVLGRFFFKGSAIKIRNQYRALTSLILDKIIRA